MATQHLDRAGDNTVSAGLDDRLSRLLTRLVAGRGDHATVAIASGDGELRWSAAVGAADRPTAGTPFFIASVTKRFIAALALQAHAGGELDLAAPITDYLPAQVTAGLHVRRGRDRSSQITVANLATHTSGLPDFLGRQRDGTNLLKRIGRGDDVGWTFTDVLRINRAQRPHFAPQNLRAPKQKAYYSDTGFRLLIAVLESATGTPYDRLLAERIIEPLGLSGTWLPGRPAPQGALEPSPVFNRSGGRAELASAIGSSLDLYSTTDDLLTFQRALIDRRLIGGDGSAHLREPGNRLRNVPILRYGFGTMTFRVGRLAAPRHRPVHLVGHSGITGSWLFHCPELDVHLAGTVDLVGAQAAPFRVMTRMLQAWSRSDDESQSTVTQESVV